jgi:hypothetical protein
MSSTHVLLDAHVHVYPQFNAAGLLTAAARNFRAAAARLGAPTWQAYLLLTETARDHWFDTAAGAPAQSGLDGWQLRLRDHCDASMEAVRGEDRLVIVAGRQIVTAERLELHAIGTRMRFADGLPARATLAEIAASGALALLPWGVGKWLGARRSIAERLLRSEVAELRALPADNGGRPWFWPERLLAVGKGPLLRGSDPLPLRGQETRAGQSGCWYEAAGTGSLKARELVGCLRQLTRPELHSYGPDESLLRFFRNQLALRLSRS